MVLSDTDINKFILRGDIKITPFNSKMIKSGSYTFTLNDTLFIPKKEKLVDIKSYKPSYKEIKIEDDG
jgi:deoxycytidine triphosphate deaminase